MINDKPSNIGIKTVANPAAANPAASKVQPPAKEKVSDANVKQAQSTSETNAQAPVQAKEPVNKQTESKAMAEQVNAEARREAVKEKVNQAIPKVRELMEKNQRSLDFKVAEKENRIIITVIDKETDKVIRQIPPEDLLQMAESLDQGLDGLQSGVMFDSKA